MAQRPGSSRSAARSSHHATQDTDEVIRLREEVRQQQEQQRAQEEYMRQMQLAQGQGLPAPPPHLSFPQFVWPSPRQQVYRTLSPHLAAPGSSAEDDAANSFINQLFASRGGSGQEGGSGQISRV